MSRLKPFGLYRFSKKAWIPPIVQHDGGCWFVGECISALATKLRPKFKDHLVPMFTPPQLKLGRSEFHSTGGGGGFRGVIAD